MNERIISLALPAGTVLRRGSDRYILGEVASFGGSSLFYTAKKEGSALRFGIKECCPMDLAGRLRREGGILTGTDDQAKYALTQARTRMLGEAEISQKVAVVSAKTIPVWEASDDLTVETAAESAPAPAGGFLILRDVSRTGMFLPQLLAECLLPPGEGHPLRTGGRPSLHTTARILEGVLRALELVHKAGYLYGDVQVGNIFFADARPEKGDIGFACLLDFGCARPLRDRKGGGKETDAITDRVVFTTPGYTAPEIVWENDGNLRLTPAADVYSAGRLLLFLLRGRTYYENGRDRVLSEGVPLTCVLPSEGERLGCTAESLRQLQSLLNWSLALDPDNRYEDAGEMLAEVEKLVDLTRPPNRQLALSFSALGQEEFLPREEKQAEIDQRLRERRKPVVVWGFAGMGKTELAIEFARRYTRGQAYFVHFRNSVRETVTGPIADGFSDYDRKDVHGREKPEEQIYREVMKLLGQRSENDLLVLDNMDGDEGGFDVLRGESAFRDLCALPMGLLVTTRSPAEGGVEVDTLPRPLLRQLLRRGAPELSDEMADALIDAVEGHTLTVDLMGRTLKHSIPRLRPEVLLEKLTAEDLDSTALPKVSSPKDREGRMARIQGHLTALFRLSDLPEAEKWQLAYALPISPEGLAAEDFARIPGFDQDALLRLIDRGWIRRSEDDILTLHPLVQETGWRELKPNTSVMAEFALGFKTKVILDFGRSNEMNEKILGYACGVLRHTEDIAAKTLATMCACGVLDVLGRFQQELEQAAELLRWTEALPAKSADASLASCEALELYARALENLGRTESADFFKKKADALRSSLPETPKEVFDELQESNYHRSGMTRAETEVGEHLALLQKLMEQGRYEEALETYQKERRWFLENGLDPTCLDIYAYPIYTSLGDLKQAYLVLRDICKEMDHGKRVSGIYVTLLLDLVVDDIILHRLKEGRALMMYAAKILQKLFPDERRQVLAKQGDRAVKLALEQGWMDEYATWLKLLHEAEDESE